MNTPSFILGSVISIPVSHYIVGAPWAVAAFISAIITVGYLIGRQYK